MERTKTSRGPRRAEQETGFSLDELQEWKNQLETVVRQHPILSAGIAVGAGVLIARLVKDALGDERSRRRRRRGRFGLLGSELGKALLGSLASMAAAKIQESLIEHVHEEEAAAEAEPEPASQRPRKRGGQRRPQTRRRKVEE